MLFFAILFLGAIKPLAIAASSRDKHLRVIIWVLAVTRVPFLCIDERNIIWWNSIICKFGLLITNVFLREWSLFFNLVLVDIELLLFIPRFHNINPEECSSAGYDRAYIYKIPTLLEKGKIPQKLKRKSEVNVKIPSCFSFPTTKKRNDVKLITHMKKVLLCVTIN